MSDFPWQKFYPPSVDKQVDFKAYSSVIDLFDESVKKYGSAVAYECMGKTMSFQELDRLSAQFANYLTQDLKLEKGSRVAIQMPNILQYPVVMFGALRAGMVVVNTNPLYTPSEMKHQFNDSGADVIVIVANFASNLEKIRSEIQAKHVIVTELGDMLGGLKGMIVN
ncbi:MAG: long-chain-fatty-acid--CoA ligase, partial [Algoriphagus sp. 32-45-6]